MTEEKAMLAELEVEFASQQGSSASEPEANGSKLSDRERLSVGGVVECVEPTQSKELSILIPKRIVLGRSWWLAPR